MSQVEVAEKTYLMPRQEGISATHFLTVTDIQRSVEFYAKVFGGTALSRGDSKLVSAHPERFWLLEAARGLPRRSEFISRCDGLSSRAAPRQRRAP